MTTQNSVEQEPTQDTQDAPKVFISYSWTSDIYADEVLRLAERLRADYIDVVLDRWELTIGRNKYKYMEQMVTNPDIQKVLCLCDKRYAEKANVREGGVGTESTIISQEVYKEAKQEKFVPVIMEVDAEGKPYLPVFLGGTLYIDLSDQQKYEEGYEELVRNISGKPRLRKPPLGKKPSFLVNESTTSPNTTLRIRAYKDALLRGQRHAVGYAEDYLGALADAFLLMRIDPAQVNSKELPDLIFNKLESWIPYRDEFVDFVLFTLQYDPNSSILEEITSFFERCFTPLSTRYSPSESEHLNYALRELFLYYIAVLLNRGRFEIVDAVASVQYLNNDGKLDQVGKFTRLGSDYLKQVLSYKWKVNYRSPIRELARQRATTEKVSFALLRETDYLLMLRLYLENSTSNRFIPSWVPMTIGEDDEYETFNFINRAESSRYFERFKLVLGVESQEDLMEKWAIAFPPRDENGRWTPASALVNTLFDINKFASKK